MNERIIKETMLHLSKLPRSRTGYKGYGAVTARWKENVSTRKTITLMICADPDEWVVISRSSAHGFDTKAEAEAYLYGKYGQKICITPPGSCLNFDLRLFDASTELPRNKAYYTHPVVQYLRDDYTPWCVQYGGGGHYFATYAELRAYIEGRWGRDIGEESQYA